MKYIQNSWPPEVKRWASELFPLVLILVAALAIRLVFFTGMVRGDDFNYAHAAYELSQGRLHLETWIGSPRLALYGPVALLYFLFGPSEITTLIYPLLCSILSIISVFAIARLHVDQAAGLLAAFLWAFLPLDIFLATDLIPDGPMAAFATTSVFFLMLAEKTNSSRKLLYYGLGLFCLVWAIWIKPLAIITFIYFLIHFAWRFWTSNHEQVRQWYSGWYSLSKSWLLLGTGFVVVVAALFYFQNQSLPFITLLQNAVSDARDLFLTGSTQIDLSETRIFQTDLLVVLAPLFLVAFFVPLALKQENARQTILWAAVLFLYYELGSVIPNLSVYRPILAFYEARNILFVLAPLTVLAGSYLSSLFRIGQVSTLLPGLSFALVGFSAISKPLIEQGLFDDGFSLVTGATIVISIASIAFVSNERSRRTALVGIALLATISIAMLKPAAPYHASFYTQRRGDVERLRMASAFLESESDLIIYSNATLALNYASDFSLGYDWAQTGDLTLGYHLRAYPPAEDISDGSLIVLLGLEEANAEDWNLLEQYGDDERAVRVYRFVGIN